MIGKFSNFSGPLSSINSTVQNVPNPNLLLYLDSGSASSYKLNGGSIDFSGGGYASSTYEDFKFGTSDFTIDLWFLANNTGDTIGIISNYYTPADVGIRLYLDTSNTLTALIYENPYFGFIQYSTPIVNETWYHTAVVRQGTTFSLYVNGVAESVTVGIANINHPSNANLVIGKSFVNLNNQFFVGLITNIRVSNIARFTENFTPSTLQLQTDANTVLLLLSVDEESVLLDWSDTLYKLVTPVGISWNPNTPITTSYIFPTIWKDTSPNNRVYGFVTQSSVLQEFGNVINLIDGNYLSGTIFNDLTRFTIDTWVNLKSPSEAAQIMTDLWDGSSDINYFLGFNYNNIRGGFWKSGGTGFVATADFTPILNHWHNFTLTYDRKQLNLFVDGETFSTINSTLIPTTGGFSSLIGKKWDDVSTIDAYLSIINVWDGALTYSTINSNYNNLLDRYYFTFHLDNYDTWDASSSVIYDLRSNLPGTVSGVTYDQMAGGCLLFGETASINFGNPESVNQNGDLSIFTWIKFTDFNTAYNIIVDHFGPAPNDIFFTVKPDLSLTNWYMNLYTEFDSGVPGNEYGGLYDTTPIQLNTWYHLGFTLKNGGDLTFYVNGLTSSVFSSVNRNRCGLDFILGSSDLNNGLRGYLGELKLYNRVLSVGEVLDLYDSNFLRYNPSFGSMTFDNTLSSHLLSTSSTYIIGTNTFTLESWFRLDNATGFAGIISTRNLSTQRGISINISPGSPANLEFYISGDAITDFLEQTIQIGEWYHAVITRDIGGTTSYYLNGIKLKDITDNNNYQNSTISIGRYYYDHDNYYFDGLISQSRLIYPDTPYTTYFLPPNTLNNTGATKFLINKGYLSFSDGSSFNNYIENTNVGFTSSLPVLLGGSLEFGNGTQRYFALSGSSDWAVGSGDFCVEWFQYQLNDGPPNFPRVFSVGSYPNESIAVSIEGGILLGWLNGGTTFYGGFGLGDYLNKWIHLAYVRQSGILSIYQNGTRMWSEAVYNNVNNSTDSLFIGIGTNNEWNGYLTNFRFVKGNYVYTGLSFSVPTSPLTSISGTKLLLNALGPESYDKDYSGLYKIITNINGVTWSSNSPFV